MLFRFCLYGFLKNQQYFDPFIILAFREKGLSYTAIGLLIGFRELCINLLEIPTGAIADVAGRRRSMICSFLAYIVSLVGFGLMSSLPALFAAMFFFSVGEAFRTGTHKAMIFDWLARQGRSDENTRIYGLTRSWSKLGSAASTVLAVSLVWIYDSFSVVFLFCIIPYALNIINFITYPPYLDGEHEKPGRVSFALVVETFRAAMRNVFKDRPLRQLLIESMGFEGSYRVCKDYLQPLLQSAALALPIFISLSSTHRVAGLVGAVVLTQRILDSFASRHTHALVDHIGSEANASHSLWVVNILTYSALVGGIAVGHHMLAIGSFVFLSILQNLWRPILIGRVASAVAAARTATVLSAESQAKTLFAALVAPCLGLAVDAMTGSQGLFYLLPVGLVGVIAGVFVIATLPRCGEPV